MRKHQHSQFRHTSLDWPPPTPPTALTPHLQMSRAFLASPDTADTFRAQNCRAEDSRTSAAEAWGASADQSDQWDQWDQWDNQNHQPQT